MTAAVSARWSTFDPQRGRQFEPMCRLYCSADFVAEEFHAVAPFDQRQPLGDQAFEIDRADFGTVLLLLAPPLRLFVVVELALDPGDGAMEEVDVRPQQAGEVGFETRVAQGGDEGVEDVGDGACDSVGFGQRSRIGFGVKRAIAVELEFVEETFGRGGFVRRFEAVSSRSVMSGGPSRRIGRAHRGLPGDERRRAARTGTARVGPRAAVAERRMAGADYFAWRWKAPPRGRAGK